MEPEIIILDEPTSNLDPASRQELFMILRDLAITQLIATHDLSFAEALCGQVVILDRGQVVANDSAAAVFSNDKLLRTHRLERGLVPRD